MFLGKFETTACRTRKPKGSKHLLITMYITHHDVMQVHMTDQVMLPLPRHSFVALGLPRKAQCPCFYVLWTRSFTSFQTVHTHTHTLTLNYCIFLLMIRFGRQFRSCSQFGGFPPEGHFEGVGDLCKLLKKYNFASHRNLTFSWKNVVNCEWWMPIPSLHVLTSGHSYPESVKVLESFLLFAALNYSTLHRMISSKRCPVSQCSEDVFRFDFGIEITTASLMGSCLVRVFGLNSFLQQVLH